MSPTTVLLQALAAARRSGEDFDTAWAAARAVALQSACEPRDWSSTFDATRAAWEASYERTDAPGATLSLLGEDGEALERPRMPCDRCGAPIASRGPARYCSAACKRASEPMRTVAA